MDMVSLSESGNFSMPEELLDFEMEHLPDKGTTNCRYLRLGRQNGERMNALARPRIPQGWKQVRLVAVEGVLYIEFQRVVRPKPQLPERLQPVSARR